MDMNTSGESEDPTFNSFSVAIGEAVCTIFEGTIATVLYVVGVIKRGGVHSPQSRSGENGEESLFHGSKPPRCTRPTNPVKCTLSDAVHDTAIRLARHTKSVKPRSCETSLVASTNFRSGEAAQAKFKDYPDSE